MIAPLRLAYGEDLNAALFLRRFDGADEAWLSCAREAIAEEVSRQVQDILVALYSRGVEAPVVEYPIGRDFPLRNGKHRQHRFDLAWPSSRVALEYDGGVFSRGGHVRGRQVQSDSEKVSLAAGLGWRIVRCASDQVGQAAGWVETALAWGRS